MIVTCYAWIMGDKAALCARDLCFRDLDDLAVTVLI